MFSGIIEATAPILSVEPRGNLLTIFVQRPSFFSDIQIGDSIASNGVCLTVESVDDEKLRFTLGQETLNVTGWSQANLPTMTINLERSLRYGDRMHGHFVSGHVDAVAEILAVEKSESWNVQVSLKNLDRKMIWPKGSVAIQGVSLTINEVTHNLASDFFTVCLIPETLHRTNLQHLQAGQKVNIEYDTWAKAFVNYHETTRMTL